MIKLQTPVDTGNISSNISTGEKVLVVGSCFAQVVGEKMREAGMDVLVNPFGTLYNPVSISNAIARLSSPAPFTEGDCVRMGSGSDLVCSFSHHTSFARATREEFLENANAALAEAAAFFAGCTRIIVTLGTAWCFRALSSGEVVSNCLKRDAREFTRERLSLPVVSSLLARMVERNPGRKFIFTVSPIRHLADGAHGNSISKSTLLLGVESVLGEGVDYFPAYEIQLDELRDYRFYAEDMVHPSAQAAGYIWERFMDWAFTAEDKEKLLAGEKLSKRLAHRPLHQ